MLPPVLSRNSKAAPVAPGEPARSDVLCTQQKITMASTEPCFTRKLGKLLGLEPLRGASRRRYAFLHLTEEGAVANNVPICCFCFKVRNDTNVAVGKGPWIDLSTYAISRE
jgi:hypothetical protein